MASFQLSWRGLQMRACLSSLPGIGTLREAGSFTACHAFLSLLKLIPHFASGTWGQVGGQAPAAWCLSLGAFLGVATAADAVWPSCMGQAHVQC
eukprot:1138894-Pelagomonas_calceolata.AAC.7